MTCPLPRYWMCHAVIATLVALAVWPILGLPFGLGLGAGIYVGREHCQKEQGGGPGLPFDWPGILAPVGVCVLLMVFVVGV